MIPLSVPHLAGNEWKYVKECLDTGWISTAGAFVNQFEQAVADFTGAHYAVAAMNGTAALHVALKLNGVRENEYVLVPNITFVASANAIMYTHAIPMLVDVNPDTWQMDLPLLEAFLQDETYISDKEELHYKKDGRIIRAIMPVHVLGNVCDLDELVRICRQYKLQIVEDATESLGSYYKGRHTGTFGSIGCFSFNGNKIISTGGGGMLITDDEELARKAKHITTTAKTDPLEYFHDEVGYNYRLVNILAALGVAQMEQLPEFVKRKKYIDAYYREHLNGIGDIAFQQVNPEVDPNCWLFTLSTSRQRALLTRLNESNVQSRPFWVPMNQLPMYAGNVYITRNDHSRKVHSTCLSIPSSVNLTESDLEKVVTVAKTVFTS